MTMFPLILIIRLLHIKLSWVGIVKRALGLSVIETVREPSCPPSC